VAAWGSLKRPCFRASPTAQGSDCAGFWRSGPGQSENGNGRWSEFQVTN
jgi:hypothetical protein